MIPDNQATPEAPEMVDKSLTKLVLGLLGLSVLCLSIGLGYYLAIEQRIQEGSAHVASGERAFNSLDNRTKLDQLLMYEPFSGDIEPASLHSTSGSSRVEKYLWIDTISTPEELEPVRLQLLLEGLSVSVLEVQGGHVVRVGPLSHNSDRNNALLAIRKHGLSAVTEMPSS